MSGYLGWLIFLLPKCCKDRSKCPERTWHVHTYKIIKTVGIDTPSTCLHNKYIFLQFHMYVFSTPSAFFSQCYVGLTFSTGRLHAAHSCAPSPNSRFYFKLCSFFHHFPFSLSFLLFAAHSINLLSTYSSSLLFTSLQSTFLHMLISSNSRCYTINHLFQK